MYGMLIMLNTTPRDIKQTTVRLSHEVIYPISKDTFQIRLSFVHSTLAPNHTHVAHVAQLVRYFAPNL